MRISSLIAAALALAASHSAFAQTVAQLYSYSLKDVATFREGYQRHLGWHAQKQDTLAWYAWTVDAGPRKGLFVDGTFGATFAALDHRPDLDGDAKDFVRNAASYATPVAVETWVLWSKPSTATPLEGRTPQKELDVFLIDVRSSQTTAFEATMEGLPAAGHRSAKLTWYRASRGVEASKYMLLLSRQDWAEVGTTGGTFPGLLSSAYGKQAAERILRQVDSVQSEIWSYEPQLSLIPGQPLEH